jgi:hypothetical protein
MTQMQENAKTQKTQKKNAKKTQKTNEFFCKIRKKLNRKYLRFVS